MNNMSMYGFRPAKAGPDRDDTRSLQGIDQHIDELLQSDGAKILKDVSYTEYNINNTMYDAQETADILSSWMENPIERHIGLDLETIGNVKEKGFAITELGVGEYRMINGKMERVSTVNKLYGINDEQFQVFSKLAQDGKLNYGSLDAGQRSVLERASRYAGEYDDVFKLIDMATENSERTLMSLATSRPMDSSAVMSGLQNLHRYWKQTGNSTMLNDMEDVARQINQMGGSGMLYTHNGKHFDIPAFNLKLRELGSNMEIRADINHVDTFDAMRLATSGHTDNALSRFAKALGYKGEIPGRFHKLETLAGIIGHTGDSHMAIEDVDAMMKIINSDIEGKKFLGWLDSMVKDTRKTNKVGIGSMFQANYAVQSNNALDGIIGRENQLVQRWGDNDWLLRRGHYYNMTGMTHITPEQIQSNKA
ncbi:MAG: hypothetical protein ACQ5SW_12285, partial [Sphaerochaetaceae bacterium]